MYEVRRLSDNELIFDLVSRLNPLIPPEYRHYLCKAATTEANNERVVIVVAFINQVPVGATLATLLPIAKIASVHSLYVDKNSRQKGIARDLLNELEGSLKKEKCYLATFLYPAQTPTTAYFEKLLSKERWHTPTLYMKSYFFNCQLFHAPWFSRHYPKFTHLEVFFWKDLKESERVLLKRREEQHAFPRYVSPFLHEEKIEPLNSLGLRISGEVVAWIITHRVDDDTIRYAYFYSPPNFQHYGWAVYLLQKSISLQQQSLIPWSLFDLNLEQTSKSWHRFIERRLKPWAQVSEIKRTWKELI